jgi:hypothetical protein
MRLNLGLKKITFFGRRCSPSNRDYGASAGLVATAGSLDNKHARPNQRCSMTRMHSLAHAAGMRLRCRGHGGRANVPRERNQQ